MGARASKRYRLRRGGPPASPARPSRTAVRGGPHAHAGLCPDGVTTRANRSPPQRSSLHRPAAGPVARPKLTGPSVSNRCPRGPACPRRAVSGRRLRHTRPAPPGFHPHRSNLHRPAAGPVIAGGGPPTCRADARAAAPGCPPCGPSPWWPAAGTAESSQPPRPRVLHHREPGTARTSAHEQRPVPAVPPSVPPSPAHARLHTSRPPVPRSAVGPGVGTVRFPAFRLARQPVTPSGAARSIPVAWSAAVSGHT